MYVVISRVLTLAVSMLITYSLYDQALKLWRTKSGGDFTKSIILALLASEIVWLNYGCSIREWPIIVLGLLNVPAAIWITIGYTRSILELKSSGDKMTFSPMSRTTGIHCVTIIDNPNDQDELWKLYERVFEPVNRQSPIMQSFPYQEFIKFMKNSSVLKVLAIGEKGEPIGIAMATTELFLEPLLSLSYFQLHYPEERIYYVLGIAVDRGHRMGLMLLRELGKIMDEAGATCYLLMHSEAHRSAIPVLARMTKGDVPQLLDTEAVYLFRP